ncbi:MAG: DUF3570 domain-containing protein [Flavobacteriaceae bacterium]|nr:DUF3570 domain-containing protein [Flavobacteriaceae bacterium]
MKKILIPLLFFCLTLSFSQEKKSSTYKKRVLEQVEVDFLSSYYEQKGENASVTGGIGNEKLEDFTPTIVISIPLNDSDVLTVDFGISTYSSASSSNGNPFDISAASNDDDDDDDDDDNNNSNTTNPNPIGSPWISSSGASKIDTWVSGSIDYSHSSEDRNTIINTNLSFSGEWDYKSFGFGGGFTKLFNQKNTSISLSSKIYLDKWIPVYPTELDSYLESNKNLDFGFFSGVNIYDQKGEISRQWKASENFNYIENKSRNAYSISLLFSQILNKNSQFSIFFDIIKQEGWLSNPLQRVYFSDIDNYYVGNSESISFYTSKDNNDVFHLADDIEKLPSSRIKLPIGARFNYFINEFLAIRTYYRYYYDDWGIISNTFEIELPIKITDHFTLYPSFRNYNQSESKYFAPYNSHLSTENFYTSDYDLSEFSSNQISFGASYTDIFTKFKILNFGLKSLNLNYSNYNRNINFESNIITFGIKFVMN